MNVAHIWDRPRGSRRNFGTLRPMQNHKVLEETIPQSARYEWLSGYALVPAILVHSNGQIALNHFL